MDATTAISIAQILTLLVFAISATWYAVPRLRQMSRAQALTALVWVHAFRNLALQLYSAQNAGLPISDTARDHAVVGDAAGFAIAIVALVALRYRNRLAPALVWLLVIETVLDIRTALPDGIRTHLMGKMSGLTWLILVYYVPLMLICLVLTVWQLVARRAEALTVTELR